MEWAPCGVFEDGGEELVQKTENTGTSTIRERDREVAGWKRGTTVQEARRLRMLELLKRRIEIEKWQSGGEEEE